MGIKHMRQKPYNLLTSMVYRFSKIRFATDEMKFRLYSDLEWVSARLAHEYSVNLIESGLHPMKKNFYDFIDNKISSKDVVLDFGCATGVTTEWLGKHCKAVVGIDLMRDRIEFAKNNFDADNVDFFCDDALSFLMSNETKFDVLICPHVLEHLDDPLALLNIAKERFSHIYIEVPDFECNYLNTSKRLLGVGMNFTDHDHIHEWDRNEMRHILSSQGLKILEEQYRFSVMQYWVET